MSLIKNYIKKNIPISDDSLKCKSKCRIHHFYDPIMIY